MSAWIFNGGLVGAVAASVSIPRSWTTLLGHTVHTVWQFLSRVLGTHYMPARSKGGVYLK